MTTLWRISRHKDLDGVGGLYASGRWHHRGRPIVYLAETPAGALLETCVHTSANDVPPKYTLLEVNVPGKLAIEVLNCKKLSGDWGDDLEQTREIGDEWLRSRRSALFRVPSALVPETTNVLLNPLHADAALLRIVAQYKYPFDQRLKK